MADSRTLSASAVMVSLPPSGSDEAVVACVALEVSSAVVAVELGLTLTYVPITQPLMELLTLM